MKIDILAAAEALSDQDLLAHIDRLAGRERSATAELVAHLAVLYARPSVYAAKGYGSLFTYCTQALKLSEDAACNRIEAAKACGRFPVLLSHLASGAMTLSSVRLVGRHLTTGNHQAVIEKAKGRTLRELDVLAAHGRTDRLNCVRAGRSDGVTGTRGKRLTFGGPADRPRAIPSSVHHRPGDA
jgi:hypothetical protein